MQSITFECETITPMFLYGAKTQEPELRPPSIKGLMRFWWRAVNSSLDIKENDEEKIKVLKEEESNLFGNSDETVGKSKVIVRVKHPELQTLKKKYSQQGISYLLYSVTLLNGGKDFIKEEFTFFVTLSSHSNNIKDLIESAKSFIYLSLFGGLGSRTRRGAGSFMIKNINFEKSELNDDEKTNLNQLYDMNNVKDKESLEIKLKETNVLNKIANKLYIFEPQNSWEEALETIGAKFKNFRDSHNGMVYETPIFGIPIRHKTGDVFTAKNKEDKIERRPSTLIFKVIKANKKFYPIIINLKGEFLPKEAKIIKNNDNYEKGTDVSNKLLNEFIDIIKEELKPTIYE